MLWRRALRKFAVYERRHGRMGAFDCVTGLTGEERLLCERQLRGELKRVITALEIGSKEELKWQISICSQVKPS